MIPRTFNLKALINRTFKLPISSMIQIKRYKIIFLNIHENNLLDINVINHQKVIFIIWNPLQGKIIISICHLICTDDDELGLGNMLQ